MASNPWQWPTYKEVPALHLVGEGIYCIAGAASYVNVRAQLL